MCFVVVYGDRGRGNPGVSYYKARIQVNLNLLWLFSGFSSEDPEENWTVFQKVVHSSAATTIEHPSRKHKDWFENDEEIKLLLEEKHCLHCKAHQDDTSSVSKKAAYNNICKTVQNRLRDMQDSWLSKKAELRNSVFCRPKGYEEVP